MLQTNFVQYDIQRFLIRIQRKQPPYNSFLFFFFDKEKVYIINEGGYVQERMLTKHPQKLITAPGKTIHKIDHINRRGAKDERPSTQKNKKNVEPLVLQPLKRSFEPPKALLFLSVHKIQKMACRITRNTLYLAFLPRKKRRKKNFPKPKVDVLQ